MAKRNRTAPTLNEMVPAGTPTAPATPPTAPSAPEKKTEKDPRYIAIVMTPELLTAIRTAAAGKPLGGFLRNIVCEKLNVTLTTATRTRNKYVGMTPEQIKTAKTAARKTAAEETKAALEYYRKIKAQEGAQTPKTA